MDVLRNLDMYPKLKAEDQVREMNINVSNHLRADELKTKMFLSPAFYLHRFVPPMELVSLLWQLP